MQTIKAQNAIARNAIRESLMDSIEANPALFGRGLVQHPSYLLDVVKSGIMEDVVEIMAEAGLNDMLWSIATNVEGYKPARMYIRDTVFGGSN